jgi:hypothetical protein
MEKADGSDWRRSRRGRSVLGVVIIEEPQQPMISIHLPDRIRGSMREELIQESNLLFPIPMWTRLSFGKHKTLSGVKTFVDGRQ